MSAQSNNGYLLLSSSDEWYKELSLAELQEVVNKNRAWVERLIAQGKVKGGVALARRGAIVRGTQSRPVLDGPYAESKEAIGGTLVLDVATLEEAVAIARNCPSLAYNTTIEVRPIAEGCPLDACARQRAQEAQLAAAPAAG